MAKILIVDDSATMRQQVRQVLTGGGFEVIEAVDGQDGLAKIKENSDLQVVILDVNMPRMNGIEMIQELEKEGRTRSDLNVVMLTTEGHTELIQQAKAAGAKGWMVKPFKPDMLLSAVQKMAR